MNSSPTLPAPDLAHSGAESREVVSQSEIERLLAQVESVDPSVQGPGPQISVTPAARNVLSRFEFPHLSLLTPAELRRLRMRHEDFIGSLAARLSIHLGMEAGLQMSKLETMPFQKFADGLSNPTYLTMLKLQPLTGIALLDIPPRLGLCLVDRELGGPGRVPEETRQVGKIEARLLSRVVSLIVNEWSGIWSDLLEVHPTVLGNESNSRFLNTSPPSTSMLVVGMEARIAETTDQMQFAFPHFMLEPLTLKLNAKVHGGEKPETAPKAAPAKWNALFDDLDIQVKAELPEIQISAGQLADLKPGDVLTLPAELMNQVRLRMAGHPGFAGNLGVSDQRRAVKITQSLKD